MATRPTDRDLLQELMGLLHQEPIPGTRILNHSGPTQKRPDNNLMIVQQSARQLLHIEVILAQLFHCKSR